MQLRLRTKLTLVMTSLVFLVVAVLSVVFLGQLLQQVLQETDKNARDMAHNVFIGVQNAITDAAHRDLRPYSTSPDDIHDYVRHALEINEGLQAQLAAADRSSLIYEVSITDEQGIVLISSDKNLQGTFLARRTPMTQLVQRGLLHQVKVLRGASRLYEHDFRFDLDNKPFGEVRIVLASGFILDEIKDGLLRAGTIVLLALIISTLLAAVVSRAALAPIANISAQLDRISAGQYDAPGPDDIRFGGPGDELGQVSRKISQVGQQLRGVHEIFSTLRENMNSVMTGLEDGLLLFTRDARAVMISPAAEKFLGAQSGQLLGRRVTEIFPPGHPLRAALRLGDGEELSEVASETELQTPDGPRRVGVSVQAIQEDGERMGALVTLRDLDSLESINTQLQVSERLAALGRITAGVAHEVKNPLNSMRL